jgi:3-hydroxyacyl-[acyl-carrier-protein] dehydratase
MFTCSTRADMPPKYLLDLSKVDLNAVVHDQEQIRLENMQRGHMEHLNAIIWVDTDQAALIGYKDVRLDEFWVEGHIPGRPLLPGVIMIEAGAQLASFYTKRYLNWTGFVGFGGVEDCKFRLPVPPGCRMYLLGKQRWERHRRMRCDIQGLVDGQIVFEAGVIGTQM